MNRSAAPENARRGISATEVLVVVGICTVLAALFLPFLQKTAVDARDELCANRLRQIGVALQQYHDTHRVFPPAAVYQTSKRPGTVPEGDELTDGRAPWTVLILPFLDEQARYEQFDFDSTFSARWDLRSATAEPNRSAQYEPLIKYQCPADPNSAPDANHSNYAVCQGGGSADDAAEQSQEGLPRLFFDNGVFYTNSSTTIDEISDGLANTILAGESKYIGTPRTFGADGAWWSWAAAVRGSTRLPSLFNISATVDPINDPQNAEYTEQEILDHQGVFQGANHGGQQRVYGSWHPGGANFLFADGHVRFLNEQMQVDVYRRLGTRADGGPADGW